MSPGVWSSNNPLAASISSTGVVTALEQGQTSFVLTSNIYLVVLRIHQDPSW
jgi:uncharacterized protein YjdB